LIRRVRPDDVILEAERGPLQPVNLDPAQPRAQGEQEGEEDRRIILAKLLLRCGCELGRVDTGAVARRLPGLEGDPLKGQR
jgi:hypothetical protein